jgi:hypothetical protein
MKINKLSLLSPNFPLIGLGENANNNLATDLAINLDLLAPLINTRAYRSILISIASLAPL